LLPGGHVGCLPTPFEVDANQGHQEGKLGRLALVRRLDRQEILDPRLLAGLPCRLESGASVSDPTRWQF
jgi:hypothetical protein